MLITNIERQKRAPQRVNIYLDDKFAFGVQVDVLAALGLKKGDNLSKEAIKNVLAREERSLAKNYALRYLSFRRRTEKELHDKLVEKEFTPASIDAVVADLRERGAINDLEFAKAFVHDTQLRRPSGKTLLQRKLRMKGLSPLLIETVLNEEISGKDEERLALEEAKKVFRRFTASRKIIQQQTQRRRLSQFLARRGFSWGVIVPTLKKIFPSSPSAGGYDQSSI